MNRGASSTKPVDGAGGAAGLDTMAEAAVVVGLGLGLVFCWFGLGGFGMFFVFLNKWALLKHPCLLSGDGFGRIWLGND